MKKLLQRSLSLLLALVLVFSLTACGDSADDVNSGNSAGGESDAAGENSSNAENSGSDSSVSLAAFKLGTLDTGSADATSAPLNNQLKLTVEALGGEFVTAAASDMSGEAYLSAVQNLISSGCNAIVIPGTMISVPRLADMCDEAHVYWGLYWDKLEEGTEDYEAAMNSEYFVATTYEDDVHSAYYAASQLGELGCKNLCMIGLPLGSTTTAARDQGIAQACEEYGMTILAEERDITLTITSSGGATITERFLTAYPECDGILIAGMTQFVLPGVIQSLEQTGNDGVIKVAGIDFNEYQYQYMEKDQLSAIIGGHFAGPSYTAILMANILNGTPLTDEKLVLENNFIELGNYEEAAAYRDYIDSVGYLYSAEEIKNCLVANNPDYTFEDFMAMTESYGLDDLLARNGQ